MSPFSEQLLEDFITRVKRQSSSWLDLMGQPDNSTTTPTGQIGEYVSSTVAFANKIGLTNNTAANVTTRSLSAGDWDVWGNVWFDGNGATTINYVAASVNTTSAALGTDLGAQGATIYMGGLLFTVSDFSQYAGPTRIQIASTTTIYLVAKAGFAVNTCSAYGTIQARRRRHFPG